MYNVFLGMAWETKCHCVVAYVVVVVAWVFVWLSMQCHDSQPIICGLMVERGIVRMENLRFIHDSDDTRCVELLRTDMTPFIQLCDLSEMKQLISKG